MAAVSSYSKTFQRYEVIRNRIILSLLILEGRLVKTKKFLSPRYIGDPINTVKIFNEKNVDEIMIFDIGASKNLTYPNFDLIKKIAQQANMPICYGGGVTKIEDVGKIISLGVEKVAMSSSIYSNPGLIIEASKKFGSQSIVAVIDVKIINSEYRIAIKNNTIETEKNLYTYVTELENLGVGEIVLNSIDLDGCELGYDIELVQSISRVTNVPISIVGGCGSIEHMQEVAKHANPSGIAAASFFIFKGKLKAVLPNYLTKEQKKLISSENH